MNKARGNLGESLACEYLERLGYVLVVRNWTTHWGELDLVMKDSFWLVFVEVKFRSNKNFGDASCAIHYYKQRALSRTIDNYLIKFPSRKWRVDIVTVTALESRYQVQHFRHFALQPHRSYY